MKKGIKKIGGGRIGKIDYRRHTRVLPLEYCKEVCYSQNFGIESCFRKKKKTDLISRKPERVRCSFIRRSRRVLLHTRNVLSVLLEIFYKQNTRWRSSICKEFSNRRGIILVFKENYHDVDFRVKRTQLELQSRNSRFFKNIISRTITAIIVDFSKIFHGYNRL